MKWLKPFSLVLLSVFLFSCAHLGGFGQKGYQKQQQQVINQFNKANQLLDNGQYLDAGKAFDAITLDSPVSQLDLIVIYNAGISYYQADQCELASRRIRKVVRLARNLSPQIEGRALVQLADIYTCLGDDTKTITTLIEASGGRFGLPADVTLAEIPARLAGAYARIGNIREAKHYYAIAERGLGEIDGSLQGQRDQAPEIAQILLGMGNMRELKAQTLTGDQYLTSLRSLQKYLYKVIEIGIPDSAQTAANEIEQGYDGVWFYIDHSDKKVLSGLEKRRVQKEKLQIAELAVQAIDDLYEQHIPDPEQPPIVTTFMNQMRHRELEFRNYIATNIVGTNLTAQALRAQGLRRAGHVLNPNPILERNALKRMRAKASR